MNVIMDWAIPIVSNGMYIGSYHPKMHYPISYYTDTCVNLLYSTYLSITSI